MTTGKPKASQPIYQIKVILKDIRPPIWRRLQVAGSTSLYQLHLIIQEAMGWGNYHLYDFEVAGTHYGDPDPEWGIEIKSARSSGLSRLVLSEGTTFAYVYDMGDNWEHEILVEKILLPESGKRYPACLTGRRGCPPEDWGGSGGYVELL
jgi:hypothetical protein